MSLLMCETCEMTNIEGSTIKITTTNIFRTKDAFALSQPERAGNEGGASRGGAV